MIDSNLAGIIPISGQKRVDYDFPWHDCLMPIGNNYYAIQNAVYECALVGCKTIWIVSDLAFQPLIKEIVQEWVMDPLTIDKDKAKESFDHVRVPIYYVPIHGKDRDRRDCLAWTVLYGCTMASEISTKMSSWMNYERFYISFPHGITDADSELRSYRTPLNNKISTSNEEFCLTYRGENVTNGLQTSFTMSQAQLRECMKGFKDMEWEESRRGKKTPAAHFSLDKVFGNLYDGVELIKHELKGYHQIDTWSGYRSLLSSNMNLRKPRAIERFERKRKRWKRMFHED